MIIPCKKCSCSDIYISYSGYFPNTTINTTNITTSIACKYCNGKGYIDDEDILNDVPRKFIKDEYFNK